MAVLGGHERTHLILKSSSPMANASLMSAAIEYPVGSESCALLVRAVIMAANSVGSKNLWTVKGAACYGTGSAMAAEITAGGAGIPAVVSIKQLEAKLKMAAARLHVSTLGERVS